MKISIIIPCFKRIEQTMRTISLLQKSMQHAAIESELIVADVTPDTSLKDAIHKTFLSSVTYTRPEKPGIATNKNAGARIATGDIFIFCDSDIEVENDTIKNAFKALISHKSAAALTVQVLWKGGPHDGIPDKPAPTDRIKTIDGTTYLEAIYSRFFVTYARVFRSVGGYNETVFNMRGEGSDLSTRYWRAGFPLMFESSIRVHHVHDAPDSMAVRIKHQSWGIAKDFLLLGYIYGNFKTASPHFAEAVNRYFALYGNNGYFELLEGLGNKLDEIVEAIKAVQKEQQQKPLYDFRFLEIFSAEKMFINCIQTAPKRIAAEPQSQ